MAESIFVRFGFGFSVFTVNGMDGVKLIKINSFSFWVVYWTGNLGQWVLGEMEQTNWFFIQFCVPFLMWANRTFCVYVSGDF